MIHGVPVKNHDFTPIDQRPVDFDLETLPPAQATPARVLDISIPAVMEPILKPSRHKGLHGGRGSTKSHTFARLLVAKAVMHPSQHGGAGLRWMCVREIQKSLQQSVKQLLQDTIKLMGVQDLFEVTKTDIRTPGGGIFVFVGMSGQTEESVKSFEGFDGAWVEEAQTLSESSLTLLRPTIRKEGSEIWFSWNPMKPTDPVDKFLRGPVLPPDSIVIQVLWKDNPFFPDVLRRDMEFDYQRDVEKADHIWGGEYEKHSELRIYKNWVIDEFEAPAEAAFLFGADWGYAVDPSVLMRGYVDGRTLYIDSEAYRVGCEVDFSPYLFDLVGCTATSCVVREWLDMGAGTRSPEPPTCDAPGHGMARRWEVIADSARPETISYMKRHGYARMEASVKGPDSVREGIDFVKTYDIVVHPRCVHTIDELRNYKWKVDPKTGTIIPIPQDKKNHVMDALRYAVEKSRKASKKKGGLVF